MWRERSAERFTLNRMTVSCLPSAHHLQIEYAPNYIQDILELQSPIQLGKRKISIFLVISEKAQTGKNNNATKTDKEEQDCWLEKL